VTRFRSSSWLFVLTLIAGCDEDPKKASLAPAQRSQAVQGPATTATAATSTATAAAAASHAGTASSKPRKALCGGALDREGKAVPKKPLGRRAAAGEPELPAEPAFGGGFTWVNFWAAWCVPCKEEIPRLKDFERRLTAAGKSFKVTFVSLDDDERQLERFMGEQPPGGLRRTYWLKEGQEREEWLIGAGVDPDPDLPAHLLVDSKGKVRCKVRGAIEDADYEGLLALLP
jgi:thiol-disulfide isomerase/thioredoxin